ncbi:MAG: PilN domain-containing protein [Serpentinimonas sp.]|nr:PilN domain-containing protein [Serpentinimonas sp.]
MIAINLLPHRELARKQKRERFFLNLGLAVGAGLLAAALVYGFYQVQIEAQQGRNQFIQAEIQKLDLQIRNVATLQQELDGLKSRQAAVESLQAGRNLPVHLLDEMVRQLPDGVHLTALRQEDKVIALTGVAQSQERVSELLRNLGNRSPWLTQPHLVEITAATLTLGPRDQRRVFNFSMRVTLAPNPQPNPQGPAPAQPAAQPAAPAAGGRV